MLYFGMVALNRDYDTTGKRCIAGEVGEPGQAQCAFFGSTASLTTRAEARATAPTTSKPLHDNLEIALSYLSPVWVQCTFGLILSSRNVKPSWEMRSRKAVERPL